MLKPLKIIACSCLILLLALFASEAKAQMMTKPSTKTVEIKGKIMARSRGANPNIKHEMSTTDQPKAASRGDACGVYFDNYTGLTVRIYVDGDFEGVVAPYSDGTVVVGSGYTTIYCVSAGGTREWNASGDCRDVYRYKLQ